MNKESVSLLIAVVSALIAGAALREAYSIGKSTSSIQFRSAVLEYETELAKQAASLSCWAHYAEVTEEEKNRVLRFSEDLRNRFSRSSEFENSFDRMDLQSNTKASMRFATEQREAAFGYYSAVVELRAKIKPEIREEALFACGG
jgi:hypothetical protein